MPRHPRLFVTGICTSGDSHSGTACATGSITAKLRHKMSN